MLINTKPCHVVQIGRDDKVFRFSADSEPVRRQVTYGEELERLRPNSTITNIVLTQKKDAKPFRIRNVTFGPFMADLRRWSKLKGWYNLYSTLEGLDRGLRIDVLTTQTVHDEAWVALLFARRKHRAIIGQIHYDIFNPYAKAMLSHNLMGRVRYATLVAVLKHFTALRVVGEGIATEIRQRKLHSRVHVIPVPMGMLDRKLPFDEKEKTNSKVLFVGRLVKQKNPFTWLKIAEVVAHEVPEASFEIVGEGGLRKQLEDFVKKRGLSEKVRFRGFVDYEKLTEIYRSASVFLITSLYEGFGRVVAEALANRVPVVAPNIVGIEDIVVHVRSGFLHPLLDVQGMADSVVTLLRNPSIAEEMGRWGETYVKEKFDPHIMTRKWVQLLVDHAR